MTDSSKSICPQGADGGDREPSRWIPRRLDLALLAAPLLCAACVACRWQPSDAPPLIAAAALRPISVVPAALATLAAVVLRRRVAALAGFVCVVAACSVLVPNAVDAAPGRSGTVLTVTSGNLYFRNPVPGNAIEAVFNQRADLVVLQEVSPDVATRLRADARTAGYPWSVLRPRWGSTGLAVLSRHPVVSEELLSTGGHPLLRVDIDVHGTVISLLDVHVEAPVSWAAAARWRAQLAAVGDIIRSAPRPVVVAGDFNATVDHAPFRRLLSPAVRDVAAQRRISRWLATWPVGRPGVLPLFQLDHVLVSPELSATGLHAERLPGSDHRLLVTSVVIPTSAGGR